MKGIFVILDGVADEPCSVLKEKTPLEFARTPNLDYLASRGAMEHCFSVREGIAPESSSALISLLGYDPTIISRGVVEAIGAGIRINNGDLVLRTNFATVDSANGIVIDSRAGRTLTTKEAKILAKTINERVKLPFKFEFYPTIQHRGILVFRGGFLDTKIHRTSRVSKNSKYARGFSDNISNADPFYGSDGIKLSAFEVAAEIGKKGENKIVFSKPLDDSEESELSSNLLNNFIRKSHEVLNKHLINLEREKKGLFPANFILCRDAGSEIPLFKKLKGKWMAMVYMPLEKGIARLTKMDIYDFKYPKMKEIDVYRNLHNGLNKGIKTAIKMLKRKRKEYDYFYIHFKETDVPGHDNKPLEKTQMIEILDSKFFSFLRSFVFENNARLLVTADHVTSCRQKAHGDGAVPVLFLNPGEYRFIEENFEKIRKQSNFSKFSKRSLKEKNKKWDYSNFSEKRFTEKEGLKGKKFFGRVLLEKTLFSGK